MTYQERIRQSRGEMSKSFARLADYLLDAYIQASFMTATELAQELELDAATVVRFSQSLGYTGFPDLLREIREHVKTDLLVTPRQAQQPDSVPGIVLSSMQELQLALQQSISLFLSCCTAGSMPTSCRSIPE